MQFLARRYPRLRRHPHIAVRGLLPLLREVDEGQGERVIAVAHVNPPATVDRLVRANLRLVTHIAGQHYSPLGHDELIAAGNLGLVIAAQRHNDHDGVRFSTRAGYWISAYIRNAIQEDSGAHKTRGARKLFWKIKQAAHEVGDNLDDIARYLGVRIKDAQIFGPHLLRGMVRLDATIEDHDGTLGDRLVVDENPEVLTAARLDHAADVRALRAALASLKPRERYVIKQRFFAEPRRHLHEIGAVLGLSGERVRQLELKVLKKLRKAMT